MADLEKREEYEEELMFLLLMIWASEGTLFWTNRMPSIRWFADRIRKKGLTRLADDVVRRQTQDFLNEIQWDGDRKPLATGLDMIGEEFEIELAKRLANTHKSWIEKRFEAEREGIDPPTIEEIYTDSNAKREAVTSLTTLVSATEREGRWRLKNQFGVETYALWELDPRSNWCKVCLGLAKTPESIWSLQFPKGPPAHPNCACFISTSMLYDN